MEILSLVSLAMFSGAGILTGLFLFRNPGRAIEVQIRFYEKINWRMEPISMQKEIRNTKIMSLFLIAIALAGIANIIIRVI